MHVSLHTHPFPPDLSMSLLKIKEDADDNVYDNGNIFVSLFDAEAPGACTRAESG